MQYTDIELEGEFEGNQRAEDAGAVDIYGGINTSGSELKVRELQAELLKATEIAKKMQERVVDLEMENLTLKKKVRTVEENISCLYKTAKLEIERKDAQIKDLRKKFKHT